MAARREYRTVRGARSSQGVFHPRKLMNTTSAITSRTRHHLLSGAFRAMLLFALCLLTQLASATLQVQSVIPAATGTEVYVRYSEPLCTAGSGLGATHLPNYTLSPPAAPNSATLLSDLMTVQLNFSAPLSGTYNLTINPVPNYPIASCSSSNWLQGPVNSPFTVGVATGPMIYAATPNGIGTDCGGDVVVYGSGFDMFADVELNPGAVAGTVMGVNNAGTVLAVNFSGGIPAGIHTLTVKNPAWGTTYPGQNTPAYSLTVQAVALGSSWPYLVSGCNNMNITAQGIGFCPSATFQAIHAVSGNIINGSVLNASPGGDQITASFNFASAQPGSYHLKVQNPGGGTAIGQNALSVGGISTWRAAPNRVGNCGSQNILIDGNFCPGDNVRLVPVGAGSIVNGSVVSISSGAWWQTMTASFNLAGATPGDYHLEARRASGPWIYDYVNVNILPASPCPLDVEIQGRSTVGYTRVNTYTVNVRNVGCAPVPASTLTVSLPASANPTLSAATAGGVIAGAVITYNIPALAPGAMQAVSWDMLLPNLNTTTTLSANSSISGCNASQLAISIVASQDPNEKIGLAGLGANHVIAGTETLPYEIRFENKSKATAPAQDVFISDQLNPAHFDLSTFNLGDITFGSHTITVPPGLTSYSTMVPVDMDGDPGTTADQLLLAVNAALVTDPTDPNYGRITWSHRSLDPATMQTPANPLLGFLPPNTASPNGEGSVKFTVKLLPNLAPGTVVGSAAVIIFDANPSIATDAWLNEISGPGLHIAPNGSLLKIWWQPAPGTWRLEQTSVLAPNAVWTVVSNPQVNQADGTIAVNVSKGGPRRFFRLHKM